MRDRTPSLRSILSAATVAIVLLALVIAGSLVAVTTMLHRTTSAAATSLESVRVAQDAQLNLLKIESTLDPHYKLELEDRMDTTIADSWRFVTSEEDALLLGSVTVKLHAYFATHTEASHQALERALKGFVEANATQAQTAEHAAERWDSIADLGAFALGGVLIALGCGVVVWLRRRAFVPVFSLGSAMERFGKGERESRAEERGPEELRDMSRRFNRLAEALAAQRKAQLVFLGGVAHDLRNPLALLKLSVELVDPDQPLPPEPRLRITIERVRKQVARLERMVGDFLDLAKIEAGELELSIGVHDARAIAREVVDLYEGTLAPGRLHMILPADPVSVPCDQMRIEQVLTNLVSNAAKYSPRDAPIEVEVQPHPDDIEFRVTDHGIGISGDDLASLFEPFHRGGLGKEAAPGVGLGLSVVRRIVHAHGGRIDVDSAPGRGSTFRVFLPRAWSLARAVPSAADRRATA
jgi:signal transduction histidine kinase